MASLLTQQIHTWCECLQGVRDSVKCLLRRSYQQPDWSYSGEAGGGGSVLCCNASRPQCPSDNIDRAWLINADENIHPAPTGPVTLNTSALLCRQRAADWASRALDLHRRLAHWGPMLLQIQPWSKHSCLKVFDLQTINDLLLDWGSCKQTSNWFFFFHQRYCAKDSGTHCVLESNPQLPSLWVAVHLWMKDMLTVFKWISLS